MFNFMTDACIHTEMQGHFNIHPRKERINYNLPLEESPRPFIRAINERCLFSESIHSYTNLALQFCIALNRQVHTELLRIMASYG